MKVAVVIYRYSESKGGAERACVNLVEGLRRAGHTVDIFAHEGGTKHVPAGGWFRYASFAKNVASMVQGYDIVQSFTRILECDVYRFGAGCHQEYLKQVATNRSWIGRMFAAVNPKNRSAIALERKSFAAGAYRRIVAVSEQTKREILKYHAVDERNVRVIYNGVDLERFRPENRVHRAKVRAELGLGEADYVALFCGTGWKKKGLNFAIEAVRRVPEARLLVVGSGRSGAYDRLGGRVTFAGSRADVERIYGAADVMAFPTLHDPFPNACLEAMASGLPTVTTRITGVAELMTPGVDGIVLEHGSDVAGLSEALRSLRRAEARAAMGEAARRTAERYTVERYVKAYLDLYEEIAAEKRVGGIQ